MAATSPHLGSPPSQGPSGAASEGAGVDNETTSTTPGLKADHLMQPPDAAAPSPALSAAAGVRGPAAAVSAARASFFRRSGVDLAVCTLYLAMQYARPLAYLLVRSSVIRACTTSWCRSGQAAWCPACVPQLHARLVSPPDSLHPGSPPSPPLHPPARRRPPCSAPGRRATPTP